MEGPRASVVSGWRCRAGGFGEALQHVRKSCENSPTSPQQKGLPREIVGPHPWTCGWDG